MKTGTPRWQRWLARSCVASAMLPIGGCSFHDRHLIASWYVVHGPIEAAEEEPANASESADRPVEGVYVAILNRGPHRRLYTVRMNGRDEELISFTASKAGTEFRD